MVSLMNQGCIEYAETAIETVICPGCERPFPTGGIVSCSDAIFKDNIVDVHLYPYTNRNPVNQQILPNFSRFFMTIFTTTDDLFTISGNSPSTHLFLDNVGGLSIMGCSFGNYSTRICETRGKGIESYSAGYFVSPACAVGNIIPCPEEVPCRFENLDYGIRAFNNNSYFTITINSAEYIHNKRGIHLRLVENPTVIRSIFDIIDTESYWPGEPLVGLYL
jgi:GT2 family glycosyltransferase